MHFCNSFIVSYLLTFKYFIRNDSLLMSDGRGLVPYNLLVNNRETSVNKIIDM